MNHPHRETSHHCAHDLRTRQRVCPRFVGLTPLARLDWIGLDRFISSSSPGKVFMERDDNQFLVFRRFPVGPANGPRQHPRMPAREVGTTEAYRDGNDLIRFGRMKRDGWFGLGLGVEEVDRGSGWLPREPSLGFRARSQGNWLCPGFDAHRGELLRTGDAGDEPDRLKDLQTSYVAGAGQKIARAYHFGSQGPGDVFTNHTSHTNRLVPIYLFGAKADLGAVTGQNSRYRDPEKIKALFGFLPENTVNPRAVYADQSDLYRVQKEAVARGVKHLFIVWFDGLDWPTTQAAAIVKTGKVYTEGKGSGLVFQDYDAGGTAQYGFAVTSPTHEKNRPDVDTQTVVIPAESLGGGYDARIAGPNPWSPGPLGLKALGYLKGQSANAADQAGVLAVGGVLHAYTDSSQSAAEMISGVKSYNNGVNVTDDGRLVTTLFHELQDVGWKVGTVTSVPFDHVSPAAMYAQNVHRDDYQDLARAMLGLPGIIQAGAARTAPSGSRRGHGDGLRGDYQSEVPGGARGATGFLATCSSPTPI